MDRRERLEGDLNEAVLGALIGHQAGLWTALPGVVVKVNLAAHTVEVKPSILMSYVDSTGAAQSIDVPVLPDVPLVFPSGGGYSLTFPVAVGDEVLVVFASRCIDAWWESGHGANGQPQAEPRMHDLSDGFAIPGPRSKPRALSPQPRSDCVELRADDESAYLRIDSSRKITAQTSGEIDLVAGTVINLTAATVNVSNNLNVGGNVVATGTVKGSDLATPTLPSYNAHVHNIISGGTYPYSAPPNPGS